MIVILHFDLASLTDYPTLTTLCHGCKSRFVQTLQDYELRRLASARVISKANLQALKQV